MQVVSQSFALKSEARQSKEVHHGAAVDGIKKKKHVSCERYVWGRWNVEQDDGRGGQMTTRIK